MDLAHSLRADAIRRTLHDVAVRLPFPQGYSGSTHAYDEDGASIVRAVVSDRRGGHYASITVRIEAGVISAVGDADGRYAIRVPQSVDGAVRAVVHAMTAWQYPDAV